MKNRIRRKGPPYKVVFGKEGQDPPAYVVAINFDEVWIKGSSEELQKKGLSKIIRIKRKGLKGRHELINLCLELNKRGLPFGYDYKTACCPSAFMMDLQERGYLKTSFDEISWQGPGKWMLTTFEVEEMGTRLEEMGPDFTFFL